MPTLTICLLPGRSLREEALGGLDGEVEVIALALGGASAGVTDRCGHKLADAADLADGLRNAFRVSEASWIAFLGPNEDVDAFQIAGKLPPLLAHAEQNAGSRAGLIVAPQRGGALSGDVSQPFDAANPGQSRRALIGFEGKIYRRLAALAELDELPPDLGDEVLLPFALNARMALSPGCAVSVAAGPWAETTEGGRTAKGGKAEAAPASGTTPAIEGAIDLAEQLQARLGVPAACLHPVKWRIGRILRGAETSGSPATRRIERKLADAIRFDPKRVVMLTPDLSTVGGIQSRTRKILRNASGRGVEYVGISINNRRGENPENNHVLDEDPARVLGMLREWSPTDTTIVFPNNTLKLLPDEVREQVERFPLIFIGSGQLTFMLQDSPVFADADYVESLKATKLVLFSRMDGCVYDQFGIHHHERGFHPVEIRDRNDFTPERNRHVGYVGRIDFYAKGADRLVEAVIALRDLGLGPLRIFTVSDPKNSPQLDEFMRRLRDLDLLDHVSISLDVTDQQAIYDELRLLLLPSRKDSFPNVVLEAYSFGVPAVGMSHAPGPAELIRDGETGFLLDEFSAESLTPILSLGQDELLRLSQGAFERHKQFGMDRYFAFIERVGRDAVNEFTGANEKRVYPNLRPIRQLQDEICRQREQNEALKLKLSDQQQKARARQAKLNAALRKGLEERRMLRERHDGLRLKLSDQRQKARARQARLNAALRKEIEERRALTRTLAHLESSYAFQLGRAVTGNAGSPAGWARMPLALWRAGRFCRNERRMRAAKAPEN